MASPTTIFTHIPKTGGAAIRKLIRTSYKSWQVYLMKSGTKWKTQYINFPKQKKKKIKVLMGHQGFGVHEVLLTPFTYFTFFRNPYLVPISWYYYILSTPDHCQYEEVSKLSFKEYVGGEAYLSNPHARRLCQENIDKVQKSRYLETAKSNLQKYYSVIGIVKRYNESLEKLCNLLEIDKLRLRLVEWCKLPLCPSR